MSDPGCCAHCWPSRCATGYGSVYAVHVGDGAKWADGSCPACREREDIAAALTAHLSSIRADMRQPCALYLVAGLAQAVTIARTGTA